ncbi:hypothetical protein [Microbacterium sp. UCD-TDU]|uniref:hypothetical protein n=1 Tax=Microbacterium sp. UCD-TDU TaxID=1247714 RepID=UPI0003481FC1|nr:hypothetical protein [Microbacterium sp. UCD-TDU]EYT61655.1 hypothetical protein D514_0102335 [Microbacterium sp. UCD-TDU]
MMHAAVIEFRSGGIAAVKFATRDKCDEWAEKHDAEVLAWAPMVSLPVAASWSADVEIRRQP